MIYDCFTFFNEIELLDVRLNELNDVVDKFVLVEGSVTFTNKKKTLIYKKNQHLFKKFRKKIIHVVVKDSPNSNNPWEIERYQFNAITRGLQKANNDDTVLLSCVDEIPKKEKIIKFIDRSEVNKVFIQRLSYYYFNLLSNKRWEGTRMLKYKNLPSSLYELRRSKADLKIRNGGWHLSYMGGVKRIQEKVKSFSHQEFNKIEFLSSSKIKIAINEKSDLFGRNIHFKITSYKILPIYVQKNFKKFSNLLLPEPKNLIQSVLHRIYEVKI